MDMKFLDFEQPIAELEAKIDELRYVSDEPGVDINDEVNRLKSKCQSLTRSIFSDLTDWQIAQLARHPQRPYALDYVELRDTLDNVPHLFRTLIQPGGRMWFDRCEPAARPIDTERPDTAIEILRSGTFS